MTRLGIIFSLLFATPAWAGEVDGNSFICKDKKGTAGIALSFRGGMAELFGRANNILQYEVFYDTVIIGKICTQCSMYRMDRKSLNLQHETLWDLDMARAMGHATNRTINSKYGCEFMDFSKAKKLVAEALAKEKLEREKDYKF